MKNLIFFLAFLTSSGVFAQTAASIQTEKTAIQQLLEKETKAAYNSDYKTWITCFAQSPDLTFGYHTALPTYMLRGYDKLASFGKTYFSQDPKPSNTTIAFTNYQIRINGNTSFVTCVQVDTEADGKQKRHHKADYLEKINGEWKILGHLFSTEPTPITEAKK